MITGKYRAGDIRHCYADISRARTLLGYEPEVTHQQGFAELAEWLREQEAEDKAETMLQQVTTYGLPAEAKGARGHEARAPAHPRF